ncbi:MULTISPECIES: hypothetical protein [unclassified Granulicatella]|uniref:hypothetical protein n=1 Tax=unclassified Granulicatella TaxID=2630493 RepID=UPI001073AF56|nr:MULTISPECIES: hypothetical protein [unclassified Granulicatella]MBF0781103.1 hypothetical protein [Granulicatella sp. 19428wC4_WM01]TFU92034.1 hypothetical protein E4T68_08340 [Granulicatella sp. WM01]
MKYKRFIAFVLGYVSLGVGQRLGLHLLSEVGKERHISFMFLGLSVAMIGLGIVLLGNVFLWYVKTYNQHNRVWKIICYSLVCAITSALGIGIFGEIIYQTFSIPYPIMKTFLWACSVYTQLIIRLVSLYVLICFYQNKEFSFHDKKLWKSIGIWSGCILGIIVISSVFPSYMLVIHLVGDLSLVVGNMYCMLFCKS